MYKWANALNYIGYIGAILSSIAMLASAVSRFKEVMLPALVAFIIFAITGVVSDHFRLYSKSVDNPERRMNPGIMIFLIGIIGIFVFLLVMPLLGLNGTEIAAGVLTCLMIAIIAPFVGLRDMNV